MATEIQIPIIYAGVNGLIDEIPATASSSGSRPS